MQSHTRALAAATVFAVITGKKVAGMFDHAAGHDRRIAAECRDDRLQGFDGDRNVAFGGTLPDILDAGNGSFISVERDGDGMKGYDHSTSGFFNANVENGLVKLFDHSQGAWFAYDIQDPDAAQGYHRAG